MSAPLSYAGISLEKNQDMPLQQKKKEGKKGAAAAGGEEAAAAAVPTPSPAKTVAAPAAAEKAAPSSRPATAKPTAASAKPAAAAGADADSSPSSSPDVADRKAPVAKTYYTGYAMVKAVPSGDTLLLAGSASGDTPEKLISLTGVLAPKFGRGKAQTDEPFAWEAREYLRKHVIGQQVQFTVQHTMDGANERCYGVVNMRGVDICEQMLKAGWVKVKLGAGGKDGRQHPEKEAMLQLEQEAAAKGVGMHRKGAQGKDHIRQIDWAPDAQALFAANKGVPLPAVVDQVRDGSTLRVELIHPKAPLKHSMITLYLAGVSAPRTPLPLSVLQQQHARKLAEDSNYKGQAPKKEEKAEPFALEAQAFTEDRLLNRDVQVILQGVDKSGNLFGSLVFAKGNISQKLLEQGLAKLVPWSAALTPDADKLKAAEAQAKAQKLRLWANWSPEKEAASASAAAGAASQPLSEFTGKVISIASADSVVVEDPEGKEIRVWLASVRAPRLATRQQKDSKDEPFAQEAKEFLRSKLIGHKIRVVPEYVRAAAADDDRAPRQFVTLFQNKVNVNEQLIFNGFAEALQHRMDEERSQFYDSYLAAESKAKEAGRGKWNAKEHVVTRVTDLTERVRMPRRRAPAAQKAKQVNEDGTEADAEEEAEEESAEKAAPAAAAPSKAELEAQAKNKQLGAKARQYLVFLQREKKVDAVVEYVFSASRFKLLVPKEHVMISFSLAGVRTPATRSTDGGKVDPLAEEILQYVRSKTMQHSVKIEVETMDKADNFLGSMFHNRVNLAVDLLQQGYASIFGFSAAKSPYAKELYAAERQAKDARKGIWKDWVEPTPEEKAAQGGAANAYEDESKESGHQGERLAKITEIVDVGDFYMQFVGDKNAEAVEKALAAVAAQPESDEPFNPPANVKGSFIAAGQFSDDSWHRVRCDGVDANGDWNVFFIDYGNADTLLVDRLRHLPVEATKIPPLAVHCALAGVSAPKAPEYMESSAVAFSEMAFGIDLKTTVEFTDKFGRKHVTLSHDSHPISVNRQMLRDGWCKVQTYPDRRIQRLLHDLQEEERYAKQQHAGVFEYGDVSDEEDPTKERVAGPDPAARPPRGKTAQGKK